MYTISRCCIAISIIAQLWHISVHAENRLFNDIADHYQRAFTCVELCRDASNADSLSYYKQYPDSVFVVIAPHTSDAWAYNLYQHRPRNLVVLAPQRFSEHDVVNLGGCEHPDIAIVREPRLALHNADHMQAMRMLADFVITQTTCQELDAAHDADYIAEDDIWNITHNDGDDIEICLKTGKPGLRAARWHEVRDTEHVRYPVTSTFVEKSYTKHHVPGQTQWIPGVNLMTFVLLRGVYPHNDQIRRMLKNLRSIDHNDLVVSNMIIQGRRLAPIDYKDPNHNAKSSRCLRAARKLFKRDTRFTDPEKAISKYRKRLARAWW